MAEDVSRIEAEMLKHYLGVLPRTSEDQVLRLIVETGARAVGADEGSLLIYDAQANDLRFVMTYGSKTEKSPVGERLPLGEGLTGLAAATGEVQIGAPVYKDIGQSQPDVIRSVIAAPMMLGDRLVGAITAISTNPDKRFTMEDGQLYACLATVAAICVHQLERIRELEEGAPSEQPEAMAPDPMEQEIMQRVARLLQRDPLIVRQLGKMLEAVEAMAEAHG